METIRLAGKLDVGYIRKKSILEVLNLNFWED